MTADEKREVREAVLAGRRALASLEEAADALDSASNWGLFDLLAGGLNLCCTGILGLYVARTLAERHGGQLELSTRPSGGALVRIRVSAPECPKPL